MLRHSDIEFMERMAEPTLPEEYVKCIILHKQNSLPMLQQTIPFSKDIYDLLLEVGYTHLMLLQNPASDQPTEPDGPLTFHLVPLREPLGSQEAAKGETVSELATLNYEDMIRQRMVLFEVLLMPDMVM